MTSDVEIWTSEKYPKRLRLSNDSRNIDLSYNPPSETPISLLITSSWVLVFPDIVILFI